ncbi:restriction endonuclease subunit R [Paenibacillus campinasensis]|uniref:Restriction endonuclease subunit R n=2 Tax=Paenibacillus campinasensis TaxID=66347 RepID=A0ABW9T6R6_9BACL|nr:restriction endonuclease subunit R [Paenibacillus campinasensis]
MGFAPGKLVFLNMIGCILVKCKQHTHHRKDAIMKSFPANLAFIYPWRSYQQKVLDQLDRYLSNRHFHLVAPPGSGKTVVGLEIIRRLNKPTLILAPTITIKEQWIDRLVKLFMQEQETPDWISGDLRNPKFLTVTTYQALHSLVSQNGSTGDEDGFEYDVTGVDSVEGEMDELLDEQLPEEDMSEEGGHSSIEHGGETAGSASVDWPNSPAEASSVSGRAVDIEAVLRQVGYETLVLDEAHHLRAEWWRSTMAFRDRLTRPNLVALTATPPYDVSPAEWQKYIELCGPIDLEISVPELVREGDLCPHQDYIYFSSPAAEERKRIHAFQREAHAVRSKLLENSAFLRMVEQHPWVRSTTDHMEAILSRPGYFSSIVIFLKEAGSSQWKPLLHVLGADPKSIPSLTLEWLEELLNGVLFQDNLISKRKEDQEVIQEIRTWLQRMGAVERRKVYLQSNRKLDRLLVGSVSKLQSIQNIVQFERQSLHEELRMVVLTDYIRLPDLPTSADDEKPLNRLGVIPIFEKLRRGQTPNLKLGVLTGSIVILPTSAMPVLDVIWQERGAPGTYTHHQLPHDPNYAVLRLQGKTNQLTVSMITELFSRGEIHVLTGTTALLGEGWDAPCINSLILASYVGSFMLSNQMRGRAIRTQPGNPGKTSTIWHLVCTEPRLHGQEYDYDMNTLARRFKTFVGLSNKGNAIENGIDRMALEPPPFQEDSIQRMNDIMLTLAGERKHLQERWDRAIARGQNGRMVEEIRMEAEVMPKPFVWINTLRALLIQAGLIGVVTFSRLLSGINGGVQGSSKAFLGFITFAAIIGILAALPYTFKAIRLFIRNGTVEDNMKHVGEALLLTLTQINLIKTRKEVTVQTDRDSNGYVYCWLEGGTTYEQTLFLDAVRELFDPIENPRYLLLRKSKLGPINREDYHAVPQWIGRNKENAELFCRQWNLLVGQAEVRFTRNLEGRQLLLNARMKSMSSSFVHRTERLSAWR